MRESKSAKYIKALCRFKDFLWQYYGDDAGGGGAVVFVVAAADTFIAVIIWYCYS